MRTAELREPAFWVMTTLARGRLHGYGIIQAVTELTEGDVGLPVTTLYKTLERLEQDGLVTGAGDEVVGGRLRRYFALTTQGEQRLALETERLEVRLRAVRARLPRTSSISGKVAGA
ncbi:PadR family transcriptional regulator [Curtobacterium flaccumfaciens]|uniref:PadR family transcriptional regulator n=2 Tax=Curtobacterium TaxID=2034 RepID=UPI00342D98A0